MPLIAANRPVRLRQKAAGTNQLQNYYLQLTYVEQAMTVKSPTTSKYLSKCFQESSRYRVSHTVHSIYYTVHSIYCTVYTCSILVVYTCSTQSTVLYTTQYLLHNLYATSEKRITLNELAETRPPDGFLQSSLFTTTLKQTKLQKFKAHLFGTFQKNPQASG